MCSLRARAISGECCRRSEFPTTQYFLFQALKMLQEKKRKAKKCLPVTLSSTYAENIDSGPNILPE